MSKRRCYVRGCINQSSTKVQQVGEIVYHKIPKNEELRQKWLAVLKKDDLTLEPSNYDRICSDHFLYEDFSFRTSGEVRLKKGAVPSVFLDSAAEYNPKYRICRAPNCNNDESDGVVLHDIPYGGKLRQKWLAAMKRPRWNPPRGTCICSDHFSNNCFKKGDRNFLFKMAVPTFEDFNKVNVKNESPVMDIVNPLESQLGEKLTIPKTKRRRKELDLSMFDPLPETNSLPIDQKEPIQDFNKDLPFGNIRSEQTSSSLNLNSQKNKMDKVINLRYSPTFEKLDKDPLATEAPVINPVDSGMSNAMVLQKIQTDPVKNPVDSGMSKAMVLQKIRTGEQTNRSLSKQIKTTQQRIRRRNILMSQLIKKREQLSMGLLNQVMLVAEDALKDVMREYLKNPENSVEETVRRSNKLCLHTEVSFRELGAKDSEEDL